MTDTTATETSAVRRGKEERLYRDVETFVQKRDRAARRNNLILAACLAASMGTNLALSFDEARHEPTRIQPVFFGVMEDGTIDTALSDRDMSFSERQEVLKDMAITYVRACEEYSYSHAQRDYDLCKNMSDDPVREAFQSKWFLPNNKDAPDSPQKQFGRDGQVDIETTTRPVFIRDNVIEVRYKRSEWRYNEPHPPPWQCKAPACKSWTATVEFVVRDKMPRGPVQGDAIKFFVTRYQVGEGAI